MSNFDIRKFVPIWFNIQPQNPLLYTWPTQPFQQNKSTAWKCSWSGPGLKPGVWKITRYNAGYETRRWGQWSIGHPPSLADLEKCEVTSQAFWIFFLADFCLLFPFDCLICSGFPWAKCALENNGTFWFSYKLGGFLFWNPYSYNLLRRVNLGCSSRGTTVWFWIKICLKLYNICKRLSLTSRGLQRDVVYLCWPIAPS